MKKITLLLITLLFVCFFVGCSNSNTDNEEIAKKELIAEIQRSLEKNDVQVTIALGDNFAAKKGLLQSDKLNPNGLIAICTNPEPIDIENTKVQKWFNEAFERVELTTEQQIEIAQMGEYAYSKALLLSSNLTAEGLVEICKNAEKFNLKNRKVQKWFKEAIEGTELTTAQQIEIAQIGEYTYSKALLLSSNLTAEGLVEICENAENFNLKNSKVQMWFKEAIDRTELTAEQKIKIAKANVGIGLF